VCSSDLRRKSSGHIIMTDLGDQGRKEDLFEKERRRPFLL
jgi:hypothetical protein